MRLIDADALIEKANKEKPIGRFTLVEYLRNAPTVEYPFYAEAYQTGYEEAYRERPQGEWKWIDYDGEANYHCSHCHYIVGRVATNYCPMCGYENYVKE